MHRRLAADMGAVPELTLESWKQLLDHSSDYYYLIDRDMVVCWANGRAQTYLGEDIVDQPVEALALDRFSWTIDAMEEVFSTGVGRDIEDQFEFEGETYALEITFLPMRSTSGAVTHVGVCVRNVSEIRRRTAEVERLEEQAQHLVDNALDMVFVISKDLDILRVSENVAEIVGWTPQQLTEMHAYTVLHPDDIVPAMQAMRAAIENPGTSVLTQLRVRDPSNRVRTLEVRGRYTDEQILVHAREASGDEDIELLRQSLTHADRLASIGRLTAGIAHEINNPASFVLTNLFVEQERLSALRERLSERAREDARLSELVDELDEIADANRRGLERIRTIVRNLRTFARDHAPGIGTVHLNEVLAFAREVVEPRARGGTTIVDERGAEIPIIESDRGQLVQIAVNLLSNALDAVQDQDDGRVVIRSGYDEQGVWFEVADNGPGIAPELAEQVFEPFFTTKPKEEGTGLGLWLCREMLERLGGTIESESDDGGARFRVHVPSFDDAE